MPSSGHEVSPLSVALMPSRSVRIDHSILLWLKMSWLLKLTFTRIAYRSPNAIVQNKCFDKNRSERTHLNLHWICLWRCRLTVWLSVCVFSSSWVKIETSENVCMRNLALCTLAPYNVHIHFIFIFSFHSSLKINWALSFFFHLCAVAVVVVVVCCLFFLCCFVACILYISQSIDTEVWRVMGMVYRVPCVPVLSLAALFP